MISNEHLEKFKMLYKDKYDLTLSDEETTELATHFLNLMEILIKPKPKPQAKQEETQVYLQGETT